MKKIIVPIDFSNVSDTCIKFAKKVAKRLGVEIEVIHCWHPHVSTAVESGFLVAENEKEYQLDLEAFLQKHNLEKNKGRLEVGFPGTVIPKLSKEEDTLLIIMGTTQEYGLIEKMLGSVASAVMKQVECPVFLIPPQFTPAKFKKVLVAGEIESTDEHSIKQIIAFTKQFDAEVKFANVSSFHEKGKGLKVTEQLLEKITRKEDIGFSFEVVDIDNHDIGSGLNDYCQKNEIDLLILLTRKHRWWENLFHNSPDPEKLALDLSRPVLVIREENEVRANPLMDYIGFSQFGYPNISIA